MGNCKQSLYGHHFNGDHLRSINQPLPVLWPPASYNKNLSTIAPTSDPIDCANTSSYLNIVKNI